MIYGGGGGGGGVGGGGEGVNIFIFPKSVTFDLILPIYTMQRSSSSMKRHLKNWRALI